MAMPNLHIFPDGDDCWTELQPKMAQGKVLHLPYPDYFGIAGLAGGKKVGIPASCYRHR